MAETTPVDPRALARVLGRLARAEAAPWLHQEIARRMAERVPVIRQAPQTWLDWWGFVGGGAQAVRAVLPAARRIVAEPTPALRQRSQEAARAPWWALGRQAGAQAVLLEPDVPGAAAQMVWANMVLHASPEPARLLQRWHEALQVGGFLMFSTFGPDTLRELREVYAAGGWPAPHPPYTDMHDIGDALLHSGFADPVMDQEIVRLSWSSPEAMLLELRELGGHLGVGRHAGLRTPRWRARLLRALSERADDQGRIAMSFEVVYGHAFKAMPRVRAGEPATVSLDEMRAALAARRTDPGTL